MGDRGSVYVALLDEGTDTWRPIAAERVGPGLFRLLGAVPPGESWRFKPGDVVRCQGRLLSGRLVLVAVENSDTDKQVRPLLRIVVLLLALPACILAGILGALAGICAELHWPLSGPNFDYTIQWGTGAGILGGVVTALVVLGARRGWLSWSVLLGIAITLLVSCVSMWWAVVSSLG